MSNDNTKKTIIVALGVCLVCSILVSTAAVSLRQIQKENKKRERLRNILVAGDLWKKNIDIEKAYRDNILPVIVDVSSGDVVPETDYTDRLHPDKFDINAMAKDGEYGQKVDSKQDLAKLKRMPRYMAIYQVMKNDDVSKLILPVYGQGLWGTMYGFIALDKDLHTITGFTFYEHEETPGLGGEVDNPRWKKIWVGKQAYDVNGQVIIRVIKGIVDPTRAEAIHQVDGLSGSTLTTRKVDNLVRFWLGDNGYGPYIQKRREG